MIPAVNHIVESTLFAVAAGMLTLVFRKHSAGVRHAIWMAASLKFLVPFGLLVALGNQLHWRTAPAVSRPPVPREALVTVRAEESWSAGSATRRDPAGTLPGILWAVWIGGSLWHAARWLRHWRDMRAVVRHAVPLDLDLPIPARAARSRIEPGVFGIMRPVLIVPEGVTRHLSPEQFDAIVAHEICHVRRRDNLSAALHMLVETVFWFHPLVWWLEKRLVEERERACDEAALVELKSAARDPEIYASGILTVCTYCLASPLPCVSGVTGANLKQRIEEIMLQREMRRLSPRARQLLAAAALLICVAPLFTGMWTASPLHAQSKADTSLSFEVSSVKENKSGGHNMGSNILPGGRYKAENVPLQWLLADAFEVPFQGVRMAGIPDWAGGARYDIEAKAPDKALPPNGTSSERHRIVRGMMQNLLKERFHLEIHSETKEMPVYSLTVAKGGPKLLPAKMDEKACLATIPAGMIACHNFNGGMGRGLHASAATLGDMLSFVENWTDRPLVDKTGLNGMYAFETEGWVPMRPRNPEASNNEGIDDTTRPTIFMVMTRMGLKLEPQKAAVERWVIDRMERPTEN